MLRRILPALLLLACLALAAPGQARAEIRLDGVDVTIELTREDRIYVTERLQAFADAPNANHRLLSWFLLTLSSTEITTCEKAADEATRTPRRTDRISRIRIPS